MTPSAVDGAGSYQVRVTRTGNQTGEYDLAFNQI